MKEPDVLLEYVEDIPTLYLSEFIDEVKETGVNLVVDTRENDMMAGIEWMMPVGIMLYLSKFFVDDFMKRAATDVNDVAYPKVKNALSKLVKRIFVQEPLRQIIVATSPNKIKNPDVLRFAVYSKIESGKILKFIFEGDWTEQEYEEAIQNLLLMLQAHFSTPATEDVLSQQITALSNPSTKNVYMLYEEQVGNWEVTEPAVLINKT